MKIKQFLMLMLMVGIAFNLSAQDASFYKKYALLFYEVFPKYLV